MQRRAVLRSLAALVPATLGATSLLAFGRQAFALGGTLPALNQPAPDFALPGIAPAADGEAVETQLQLADFRGRWLVLYFYPRDFTGGCTLEARGFQKDLAAFEAANAAVVGVSADDAESHADFCSSEGLAFPLLSDPAGSVSRAYGSWIAPFSQRHTFLIDPVGVLRSTWVAVRPSGHSAEVLATLQELQISR
ncbi:MULTISPECIES: peroxiredoxin [Synechococcales]|jgi:peroxiredoxin Q/BCP|uniref:peroxiredoxin n=1 Tax=Synechococcales TaxID=1890424 RepID=UPI000B98A231|nr:MULTISPECIES: peroxiredoxin [Synechococcales]MCP9941136.1 peroxiredoxin [Cyanobium sp. ATX 6E8]